MTKQQYKAFCAARDHFRELCGSLDRRTPGLREAQQILAERNHHADYRVETPVVYNQALDEIDADSDIKLLLVGDNPGRREQQQRRYLVGPSGKIAAGFFAKTPELAIDFRKNVLIINKTPVHTCRTAELKQLAAAGGAFSPEIARAIAESQQAMAGILRDFYRALSSGAYQAPIWIVGYSEMKKGGIFEGYTRGIKALPFVNTAVFLYRHFSMNQFTIELNKELQLLQERQFLQEHQFLQEQQFLQERQAGETITAVLHRIGTAHREKILGVW
jgi:hypothetical protein